MIRKFFIEQVCMMLLVSSQVATGSGRDSTLEFHRQKVLIIPYEPRMHLSDADIDISEYSDRTPQQVRAMFRSGITEKINSKLGTTYQTYSLLQDMRPEAITEMDRIYSAIDYSFDTSYAILHPRPDSTVSNGKWSERKAGKKELEKRTLEGDVKFMNVKILDPNLLSYLGNKYGTDLFVFLTQAEIKTKARDCFDFQTQNYHRDIKIHYVIFDKNGKELYGDVALVKFPSNSNDIGEIMAKNFPALSEKISESVSAK